MERTLHLKPLSLQDFGVTEKMLMKARLLALEAEVERLRKENATLIAQRDALQRRKK